MLRKLLFVFLAAIFIMPAAFAQSTRSNADFVETALDYFNLDSVGRNYVQAERMEENYQFYPAIKNGNVVGYLWWAKDFRVANHLEDVMLLIEVRGNHAVLKDFWISYNDHHLDMGEEKIRSKFAGMTYDNNWNDKVDTVSGSTLSSYTIMAEAKKTLFVFEKYVIEPGLL